MAEHICPNCKKSFIPWRYDQRFCCVQCGRDYRHEEARLALAAWRAKEQEHQELFTQFGKTYFAEPSSGQKHPLETRLQSDTAMAH